MIDPAKILVVDDTPMNVKLLADLLKVKGFTVLTAANGEEAMTTISTEQPDLVLLDIMMPGIDGYDVCRAIRADPSLGFLPVIMVTSLDAGQERIRGLEAGADDFLSKPIHPAELLARVKSLLRIKALYDEVERSKDEIEAWNKTLERRVAEGVAERERLARMKRFLSPQVAELILSGGTDDPLRSHRREITVVFLDLRGFTAFTETADPEEVMAVLREYHAEMGRLIIAFQGTLERFAGDGIMIFFNDPVTLDNPAEHAVRMAVLMQQRFAELAARWRALGYDLRLGIGIAQGLATLGTIGFEGRQDYGAIGNVTNLAARLCSEASTGKILVSRAVLEHVENLVVFEPVEALALKGFARPVDAFNVCALR